MTTPRVTVPVEPTEALRLVPDRVLTETLYWMARAYERVHSMPRVSDTELANKIETAKADLGRARDASPVLTNSAAPAPEGVAVRPVHIARASGTIDQQLAAVRQSETYKRGDTVLCWVNEGDLYANPSVVFEDLTALATREEAPVDAGVEGAAWEWIAGLYPNDASSDLAYDANEMIDAFIAGASLRAQPQAREGAQPVACRFCDGAGWEDDQNWEPRYVDVPQEREKGDGLIRCGHCLGDGIDPSPAANPAPDALREHERLFEALRDQSWDLRCFDIPTGGDDYDIGWRVVGHWQAEPRERTIAEVFYDDPAEAVRQALATLQAEQKGGA